MSREGPQSTGSSRRTLALAVLCGAALSGCIHTPIAMMTSTRPLQQGGYRELGPVSESDCMWYLFGFIPVSSGNTMQRAMNKAIEAGHGDALIQVTSDTFFQYFIILSRYCTQIEGIAVQSWDPNRPPPPPR